MCGVQLQGMVSKGWCQMSSTHAGGTWARVDGVGELGGGLTKLQYGLFGFADTIGVQLYAAWMLMYVHNLLQAMLQQQAG